MATKFLNGSPLYHVTAVQPAQQAEWDEDLDATALHSYYRQKSDGWDLTAGHDMMAGCDRKGRLKSKRGVWQPVFHCDNLIFNLTIYVTETFNTVTLQIVGFTQAAAPTANNSVLTNNFAGGLLLPLLQSPASTTTSTICTQATAAGAIGTIEVTAGGVINIWSGAIAVGFPNAGAGGTNVTIPGCTITYDKMKFV